MGRYRGLGAAAPQPQAPVLPAQLGSAAGSSVYPPSRRGCGLGRAAAREGSVAACYARVPGLPCAQWAIPQGCHSRAPQAFVRGRGGVHTSEGRSAPASWLWALLQSPSPVSWPGRGLRGRGGQPAHPRPLLQALAKGPVSVLNMWDPRGACAINRTKSSLDWSHGDFAGQLAPVPATRACVETGGPGRLARTQAVPGSCRGGLLGGGGSSAAQGPAVGIPKCQVAGGDLLQHRQVARGCRPGCQGQWGVQSTERAWASSGRTAQGPGRVGR